MSLSSQFAAHNFQDDRQGNVHTIIFHMSQDEVTIFIQVALSYDDGMKFLKLIETMKLNELSVFHDFRKGT